MAFIGVMSDLLVVCPSGPQPAEYHIDTCIRYHMVQTLGTDANQPPWHIWAQAAGP